MAAKQPQQISPDHRQFSLFDTPAVIDWLPDETLYSLCSRYHVISGNHNSSITCQYLFGHKQKGSQHDFPALLNNFIERTQGILGDSKSIIYQHTILPFYFPFRDEPAALDAIAAVSSGSIGSLKYRLGILTSRFRAIHPLRACPECIDEDRKQYQVAYWHLSHQHPGVNICIRHMKELYTATVKSNGIGRFLWYLPCQDNVSPMHNIITEPQNNSQRLQRLSSLAEAAIQLANLDGNFHFDPNRLHRTYLQVLYSKGLCSYSHRLKRETIQESYYQFILSLNPNNFNQSLPSSENDAFSQVSRLLYKPRSGTHPLRHLLVIIWLFKDWKTFFNSYIQPAPNCTNIQTQQIEYLDHDCKITLKQQLINHIKEKQKSISAAANHFGVDVSTAQAWASEAGLPINHRAKKLKPNIRKLLIVELEQGIDKSTAANKYNISLTTVSRLLRTETGLLDKWQGARWLAIQKKHHQQWFNTTDNNPFLGIQAVRLLIPSTYTWLYRNDRQWLNEQSAKLARVHRSNNVRVDWDTRDQQLSENVKSFCMRLRQEFPHKRITLQSIYANMPELKPLLSCMDRLPLTRQIINRETKRGNSDNQEPGFDF